MKSPYQAPLFQTSAVQAACDLFRDPDWPTAHPDATLCDRPYFTFELAVNAGKVCTYLETIYALYREHGWQKYLIVVPNLALHGQVLQILQETMPYFALQHGVRAHYASYDSTQPSHLRQFLQEDHLGILVINAQAFYTQNESMRKIREHLDAFASQCPLELLAKLQPIVILDEPQRILGDRRRGNFTQQCLADFNPRFLLGYASRHHATYSPIFRFTLQQAHAQHLVKSINLRTVDVEDELELRRQQIRETISAHLAQEARLFPRGIKTLSIFFIDDVARFRLYEDDGEEPGLYVKIFEAEYAQLVTEQLARTTDDAWRTYLQRLTPSQTYQGYFAINKLTQHIKNSSSAASTQSDSAYQTIRHHQTKLLDLAEPTRFIFTHSGLHEGWENPNIFQICPLHRSGSELRCQCELDRGLPLCVDQYGVRQDLTLLSQDEFVATNQLTVIADRDYSQFVHSL